MNLDEMFARGFCSVADQNERRDAFLKLAQEQFFPTRELDKDERNELFNRLPEARKEQIKKFILEIINKEKAKSYIVKAKAKGIPKGEYTYVPETDSLTESESQRLQNLQDRNHAKWTRKMWLGF